MRLFEGDCLSVLKGLPDNSVDSIVTDPPYGLSFMGKKWDYDVPSVKIWRECLRVLKSGGHLLAFAGSRTYHRMAVNIEDAGFEIRDQIMWVYGSGFPKSHNISKAIDKAAGAEREIIGEGKWASVGRKNSYGDGNIYGTSVEDRSITAPATPEAKQWDGWGTALKPAHEPIVVARKPLIGTIVENVLEYGTGGLNIDGCRVEYGTGGSIASNPLLRKEKGHSHKQGTDENSSNIKNKSEEGQFEANVKGRFPANFIHDGSDEVVSLFPNSKGGGNNYEVGDVGFCFSVGERSKRPMAHGYNDGGSADRFFYCAKAAKKERNAGLEGMPKKMGGSLAGGNDTRNGKNQPQLSPRANHHPTVKPVTLMKYLCRLVTPPNGIVLDPFMGSGTTGIAAKVEGFDFIGIEMDAEYLEIAEARIGHWVEEVETTYKTLYEWV
jgi:DNA modification methylase